MMCDITFAGFWGSTGVYAGLRVVLLFMLGLPCVIFTPSVSWILFWFKEFLLVINFPGEGFSSAEGWVLFLFKEFVLSGLSILDGIKTTILGIRVVHVIYRVGMFIGDWGCHTCIGIPRYDTTQVRLIEEFLGCLIASAEVVRATLRCSINVIDIGLLSCSNGTIIWDITPHSFILLEEFVLSRIFDCLTLVRCIHSIASLHELYTWTYHLAGIRMILVNESLLSLLINEIFANLASTNIANIVSDLRVLSIYYVHLARVDRSSWTFVTAVEIFQSSIQKFFRRP